MNGALQHRRGLNLISNLNNEVVENANIYSLPNREGLMLCALSVNRVSFFKVQIKQNNRKGGTRDSSIRKQAGLVNSTVYPPASFLSLFLLFDKYYPHTSEGSSLEGGTHLCVLSEGQGPGSAEPEKPCCPAAPSSASETRERGLGGAGEDGGGKGKRGGRE